MRDKGTPSSPGEINEAAGMVAITGVAQRPRMAFHEQPFGVARVSSRAHAEHDEGPFCEDTGLLKETIDGWSDHERGCHADKHGRRQLRHKLGTIDML